MKKLIFYNRRIVIREVADDVSISLGSGETIFTDFLGMKRAAAKIAPRLLNIEQKQYRTESLRRYRGRSTRS